MSLQVNYSFFKEVRPIYQEEIFRTLLAQAEAHLFRNLLKSNQKAQVLAAHKPISMRDKSLLLIDGDYLET